MKTFLVVTLYTTMVAALDVSGAVWTSLRAGHAAKTSVVMVARASGLAKTGSAVRASDPIPSDS